jgi:hypothetical protein
VLGKSIPPHYALLLDFGSSNLIVLLMVLICCFNVGKLLFSAPSSLEKVKKITEIFYLFLE